MTVTMDHRLHLHFREDSCKAVLKANSSLPDTNPPDIPEGLGSRNASTVETQQMTSKDMEITKLGLVDV